MYPGSAFLAATTPEVGPGELLDYVPILYQLGWFLLAFLAVTVVGWFVFEPVLSGVVRRRNPNNPTIHDVITRYLRLIVVVVALLIGLAAAGFGYVVGDSLLVVAAGTLAVGVAGQTVLGSLVSGIVLVSDPEFNVGDYIVWSDGEGTIQSITLRVTRVVTPEGKLVTVPNTTLTDEPIERPYGRPRHRLEHEIGIDYEADLDVALGHLYEAATDLESVAAEPTPRVYVTDLASDWVTCTVLYWIADPDRQDTFEVRSDYAREAKARLEAADVPLNPATKRDLEGSIAVEEPT